MSIKDNYILISAFIGSENLGDEAIFESLLANLQLSKKEIVALSINEEKTQRHGVRTLNAKNPLDIVRGIRHCRVFLLGGGGIIQNESSFINLYYYMFQILLAKIYKKRIALIFVGVGPIRGSLNRFLLSKLINHIELAIVRDAESVKILKTLGMKKEKICGAHDVVLNIKNDNNNRSQTTDASLDKPYFVLSARRWFFSKPFLPASISRKLSEGGLFASRYKRFTSELSKAIDQYLEADTNIHVLVVPFYNSEDLSVSRDIIKQLNNKDRVILCEASPTASEFIEIVENSEYVVGMRLHSLILAAVAGKAFVPISYSSKVSEFATQLGVEAYITNLSAEGLNKLPVLMERVSHKSTGLEKRLKKKVILMRNQNKAAMELINKLVKTSL